MGQRVDQRFHRQRLRRVPALLHAAVQHPSDSRDAVQVFHLRPLLGLRAPQARLLHEAVKPVALLHPHRLLHLLLQRGTKPLGERPALLARSKDHLAPRAHGQREQDGAGLVIDLAQVPEGEARLADDRARRAARMLEQGLRHGRERLRECPGVRGGNQKIVRQVIKVADDEPWPEGDGLLQQLLDGGARWPLEAPGTSSSVRR